MQNHKICKIIPYTINKIVISHPVYYPSFTMAKPTFAKVLSPRRIARRDNNNIVTEIPTTNVLLRKPSAIEYGKSDQNQPPKTVKSRFENFLRHLRGNSNLLIFWIEGESS